MHLSTCGFGKLVVLSYVTSPVYRIFIVNALVVLFFFFKHKTAYEMRISDWSSDVCSSDLPASVRVVASAMVKGTSRMRARVCASRVLPQPVGPTSRMFDFASSTSDDLAPCARRL